MDWFAITGHKEMRGSCVEHRQTGSADSLEDEGLTAGGNHEGGKADQKICVYRP